MNNSKIFKLNQFDFLKGLLIAVLTAVLSTILQMLANVPPLINWEKVAIISITSAISYLLKQLATNEKGEIPILKIGGRPRRKPRKPRIDNDNEIDCDYYNYKPLDTLLFFTDLEPNGVAISIIEVNYISSEVVRLVLAQNIPFNDFESIEFEIF